MSIAHITEWHKKIHGQSNVIINRCTLIVYLGFKIRFHHPVLRGVIATYFVYEMLVYPKSTGFQVGCLLSLCSLVDAALYCLFVWVNNNCLINWATLTTWASPPLSLAVRCGCGLLQSFEILSVCTANQRSACGRDVVLLSRQPPTFLS